MGLEILDMGALSTIDAGRLRVAWEQAMDRMRRDCYDRPGLEKARKVTLTMTMTPIPEQDGSMRNMDVQFEVSETSPKRESPVYSMKAERGGLFFNDLSKENPNQRTLDDINRPKGGASAPAAPTGTEGTTQ